MKKRDPFSPAPFGGAASFAAATWLLVIGALLAEYSCSTLGLSRAGSFEQKYAYALATHTAVLETAAQGVKAGTLNAVDGQHVLKLADESRALLDSALAIYRAHDEPGANSKLNLATVILTELQNYLKGRSP